jgi:hypothetical protein
MTFFTTKCILLGWPLHLEQHQFHDQTRGNTNSEIAVPQPFFLAQRFFHPRLHSNFAKLLSQSGEYLPAQQGWGEAGTKA